MQKAIDIRGIERHTSATSGEDGGMLELANIHHSGGVLRPAPDLSSTGIDISGAGEGAKLMYVHRYGEYEHYIVKNDAEDVYYIELVDSAITVALIEQEARSVRDITSVGNMLVFLRAEYDTRYYIWNGEGYELLNDGIDLPRVGLLWEQYITTDDEGVEQVGTFESDAIDIIPDVTLTFSQLAGYPEPHNIRDKRFVLQLTEQFQGLLANYRTKAVAENVLVDSYLVRYGYRMYDGNYIYVSEPVLLRGDAYKMSSGSVHFTGVTKEWEKLQGVKISGTGMQLSANLNEIDTTQPIMSNGVVVAVDIFLSLPIPEYDSNRRIDAVLSAKRIDDEEGYDEQFWEMEFGSMQSAAKEDIEQYFNYYRVASYPIEEIERIKDEDGGVAKVDISTKIDSIEQQPLLEYDQSVHDYMSSAMTVYNGRLHLANIQERLYSGKSLDHFSFNDNSINNAQNAYTIFTYIRHDNESYVVRSETTHSIGTVSSYISYPDSRAYRMDIVYKHILGDDVTYYLRRLSLRQHPFMDASYWFEGFTKNDLVLKELVLFDEDYEIGVKEYNALLATPIKNEIARPNVMKVSELHNPMLYPADKTYSIGSGRIVAMGVATKAVSQGQFGQYPLYVFTDEGIYAMLAGEGKVLYANMAPVNRHVVEHKYGVCGIDDAVVYATRQGLFIMQGSDSYNISTYLNEHGVVPSGEDSLARKVFEETYFGVVTMHMAELLASAKVAYNYKHNEILLHTSNICYVYNLTNKVWSRRMWGVIESHNSYPDLYIIRGGDTKLYHIADDGEAISPEIVIATQPIHFGSALHYKKLARLHIPAYISGGAYVKVSVAVSNDGEQWRVAWRGDCIANSLHNITLSHVASAYRYYSVIIQLTNASAESYIGGMVADVEYVREER